jgi:glycosyltransferase involved in cell wall biosynthesis
MPVAFVMPCLNEKSYLGAAVKSLGFGEGAEPADEDVFLILVDNGSTDGTIGLMQRIAAASRQGSVRLVVEAERGFVPPRRRGVAVAAQLAVDHGVPFDELLVLQADADTVYRSGYARWMWNALEGRRGFLLEGALRRSEEFDAAHQAYRDLERSVDGALESMAVDDQDDVVVDDKACGYLVSDYLRWGGHAREFDDAGSEVHAETTRLYIRARLAHGAVKLRVNPAQATASRRRILEDPALQFATAGFPREESWVTQWRQLHPRRWAIDEFARTRAHPDVHEAVFYRAAHEIALFVLLPWLVGAASGRPKALAADHQEQLRAVLPTFSRLDLVASPAAALIAVLRAIERHRSAFVDAALSFGVAVSGKAGGIQ